MANFFKPIIDFTKNLQARFLKPIIPPAISIRQAHKTLDEFLMIKRYERKGQGGKAACKAYADRRQKSQHWRKAHGLNFELPGRKL